MNEAAPKVPLHVSVVHAGRVRQFLRELTVPAGTTAAEAIERSGIREVARLGDGDLGTLGIFGRRVEPTAALHEGDRVEIYRELTIDPKEARRRRAKR